MQTASPYPKDKLILREVGLRDGLQMVRRFPSTQAKQQWIKAEATAGVRHFEVGSFLPAKRFPQFADLNDLIALCQTEQLHSAALALNGRGVEEAVQSGVAEIVTVVSATEDHSQANMRRDRQAALELVSEAVNLAANSNHKPLVQVGISMAFGCSIAGEVAPDEVLRLAVAAAEAGADLIGLADTVGFAGPDQISNLTGKIMREIGNIPLSLHLHDTRGLGLANAAAGMDAGVRILDGSLGGLGGCPFAPGATGNVVFEDLVFLAERKGFATGIDLDALVAVRDNTSTEMPGETFHGTIARAGTPNLISWRSAN